MRADAPSNGVHAPPVEAPGTAAPLTTPDPGGLRNLDRLLWDLKEVAQALHVSSRTVKRMAACGEPPGVVHLFAGGAGFSVRRCGD